ncbi:MAG: putative toxin-antitoxin system toxin component, PIN family [Anaerolineae bacterium]|nr:putative toxin-antitoxin system toxin component, PIN family [Anaerolineae bacterium]
MRVILDTSVIVSGMILPKGPPAKIISHWLNNKFTLLYTKAMLAELEDVLNRAWLHERLSHAPSRTPEFLEAVTLLGQPVKGYVNVTGLIRDPFDEMFLACAILGNADFLVSGDKDLLTLAKIQQTFILPPTQFLSYLSD